MTQAIITYQPNGPDHCRLTITRLGTIGTSSRTDDYPKLRFDTPPINEMTTPDLTKTWQARGQVEPDGTITIIDHITLDE